MTFTVILHDAPGDRKSEMRLPFAPFPGLNIQAPYLRDDYVTIEDVFWNGERFECYAKEET